MCGHVNTLLPSGSDSCPTETWAEGTGNRAQANFFSEPQDRRFQMLKYEDNE